MKDIIAGCKANDRKAQRALVDQYLAVHTSVARRYLNDPGKIDDVVQTAFISIFQHIENFRNDEGSFEGWMYRIVVNKALQQLRRPFYRIHNFPEKVHNETAVDPEVIDKFSEEDIMQRIQQLPEGYREVFNLHVIDGYSHREIGKMLEIEEASSRSRLSRAKQMLRKTFKDLHHLAV